MYYTGTHTQLHAVFTSGKKGSASAVYNYEIC